MFGSTNQAQSGTSSWNSATGFGGLFGNSATNSSGLSNTQNSGIGAGLFSQNPTSSQSQNSTTPSASFGPNSANNMFSGAKVDSVVPGPASVNSTALLTNVNASSQMPPSITESIFFDKSNNTDKRRPSSSGWIAGSTGASLLSKLAKTFNIFRTSNSDVTSFAAHRGIFTANNYPSTRLVPRKTVAGGRIEKKTVTGLDKRHASDIKKLIIKSKPLKFHLIDADKVINSKKKRITHALPALKSERDNDDSSDGEADISSPAMSSSEYASKRKTLSPDFNNIANTFKVKEEGSYWTSPSIKELSTYSSFQLENVENFIIGRKGFGQIAFNTPVDLSRLQSKADSANKTLGDLLYHDIAEIGWKYVKVYKDDATKPHRGAELNVPASITLEKMLPDKDVTVNEYIRKLQQLKGMEFVTYDPITYTWVFKVAHFSIWGLVDESEKGDKLLDEEEEKFYNEIKRQKLSNETKHFPGSWKDKTSDSILEYKRNLVTNEIGSQLSKFNSDEDNKLPVQSFRFDNSAGEKSNYDYLKEIVRVLPENTDLNEVVNEKAYEPEIIDGSVFDSIQPRPNIAVSDDWLVQLKLSSDLNSALAKYLAGSTGSIERDNHLDLMQVDNILFDKFDNNESSKEVSTPASPAKADIEMNFSSDSAFRDSVESILQYLLKHALVQGVKAKINVTTFSEIADCCQKDSELFEVFVLLSALFDNPESETISEIEVHLRQYSKSLKQKQVFVSWLNHFNANIKNTLIDSSKDVFDEILVHIYCGEIKAAIEKAIDSNNNHLSVLLTLCDTNYDGMKEVSKAQLEYWESSSSLELIPAGLVKIYKFLGGDLEEVLADSPWSIRLSAHVIYDDARKPLSDIVDGVSSEFDEDDTIIEILRLFSNQAREGLNIAIDKLTASSISVIHKWIVSLLLVGELPDDLHLQLGEYLVGLDLLKEALFVYSLLQDKSTYTTKTSALLVKNIDQIYNPERNVDERKYLKQKLYVPEELIYEAIAMDKRRHRQFWDECEAWIKASKWQQVHDCIVDRLGPATVISKNKIDIQRLREVFSSFPDKAIIPAWAQGAGVYEAYFDVVDHLQAPEVDSELTPVIESLVVNLSLLGADSFETKVAVSLMAKDVGDLAIKVGTTDISSLPLGENEKVYFRGRLQPT